MGKYTTKFDIAKNNEVVELLNDLQNNFYGVKKLITESNVLTPAGIKVVKAIEKSADVEILWRI